MQKQREREREDIQQERQTYRTYRKSDREEHDTHDTKKRQTDRQRNTWTDIVNVVNNCKML